MELTNDVNSLLPLSHMCVTSSQFASIIGNATNLVHNVWTGMEHAPIINLTNFEQECGAGFMQNEIEHAIKRWHLLAFPSRNSNQCPHLYPQHGAGTLLPDQLFEGKDKTGHQEHTWQCPPCLQRATASLLVHPHKGRLGIASQRLSSY